MASSLLWVLLSVGRHAGVFDAEASLWLSLGVVVAALYAVGSAHDGGSSRPRASVSRSYRRERRDSAARRPSRRYRFRDASR